MDTSEKYTGIILCGGKANRMGQNKGLMKLNGKKLIEYPLDILNSFCDEIFISSNNSDFDYLNLPVIKDVFLNIGPAGGISACLNAAQNQYVIILSCDTPFISKALIKYLLKDINDYQAVIPVFKNREHPLCGIFSKQLQSHFNAEIKKGNYAIKNIITGQKVQKKEIYSGLPFYQEHLFLNINSPEHFKLAENLIKI